jgi:hypothetical protein
VSPVKQAAPAPSKVVLDSGDVLRVLNDDTVPFVGTYAGRTYEIAPKQTALVPFGMVCLYWGDPRSRPQVVGRFNDSFEKGSIPKREKEINRLGVKYGVYTQDIELLNADEWPANHQNAGEPKGRPVRVKVQTENGAPVIPACFDTKGERVYGAVRKDSEDLNDEVLYRQHLENELDAIKERLRQIAPTEADDAEVDVPNVK